MAIIFRVSTGRSRMLSESIRKRAGTILPADWDDEEDDGVYDALA